MKKVFIILILLFLFSIPSFAAVTWEKPKIDGLSGFIGSEDISSDNSGTLKKHPPATIPKTWKLISVSSSDKFHFLWFQAPDGNVYMVDGFMQQQRFIINGIVHKLNIK